MNPAAKQALLEALRAFGSCEVTVGGGSMRPFIRPGDAVTIASAPLKLRRGMVIAFFSENQLIVHRIIGGKQRPNGLRDITVHGDSSPFSRAVVSSDRIIGRVVAVKRNGRNKNAWLHTPLSLIAIVAGFALQAAVRARVTEARKGAGKFTSPIP